jgi:aryl-phospho-beta-D-glucosidase BglC (GH1 family)
MKRKWLVLLVVAICTAMSAQSRFVHADGKYLAAPDGKRLQLRGTNLGNWLEPEGYMFGLDGGPQSPREIESFFNELIGPEAATKFWEAYRDAYVTEDDIRFLHQTGMNSIRIPLHYKFFLPGNEEGFTRLDRVVGWARKYDLYVILDMHCAPGGQTGTNIDDSWGYPWLYESAEDQELTIRIWKRIAEHYRDNPTVLGYDLLNEPIPHYPQLQRYNTALEPLYKRITAEIRQVDPNHVIILGGAQWDSNFNVFGPPFDRNVMYTFHKYWTPPTEAVIQSYLDFRARYNVPLWLGESGENTDAWIHDFTGVLEKDEIGWAFWPYKKMEKTSAPVSWQKPVYWDEIVAFAKTRGSTGDAEKQIAVRPSLDHSRAALQDLLQKIQFHNCQVNPGYLGALGLKVPPS